jgi:thiosulfate/3-mercaptopyruvate sulfurtransferase
VSSEEAAGGYPNADLLASAAWLKEHIHEDGVMVVDVRADKYFDGELIPGAIRLPWKAFRYNNTALHVGSVFVGVENAQRILGDHGIMPSDTVVLYDSVKRDGGATSSYVFWILDMLGHEKKRVLNGGIDAWRAAGGSIVTNATAPEPVLYQADPAAIHPRLWADGEYIYERLGDPYYQIIDVRSREEYIGEKGNTDLNDMPLKLGHIPTAINIEYKSAWIDERTKLIKPYARLQQVYRGLDPAKATVVYCHSGRRSSFSYFVLRLMGFSDVIEYEGSWNEWGSPREFFPTELTENRPSGDALPGHAETRTGISRSIRTDTRQTPSREGDSASTGYVSCGG